MHKVFITGSSIICALGNNKKESINKLKNINNKNYKEYLKENFEDINYYKIKQNFKTQKEKFFSILEKTILDAINDAKLSKEDRENLIPIFVFNNELPYSIGDTQVCFYNKDSKETIFTNDTNVVVFSDYEVVMLNKPSLNNSQMQLKQNLIMGLL